MDELDEDVEDDEPDESDEGAGVGAGVGTTLLTGSRRVAMARSSSSTSKPDETSSTGSLPANGFRLIRAVGTGSAMVGSARSGKR